jgi:hypothetical protein
MHSGKYCSYSFLHTLTHTGLVEEGHTCRIETVLTPFFSVLRTGCQWQALDQTE